MESFNCPNCKGILSNEVLNGRTECPYCGSIILVGTGGNEVKDIHTGLPIAIAECPKGFVLGGALNENLQSSAYPLTTLVWCDNEKKGIRFFRESGKAYQHVLKHLLIRHVEGQMEQNYMIPTVSFKTIEEYLDLSATEFAQGKEVKLEKEMDLMPVNVIDDSIPRVVQVEMELQATRLSYGIDTNYAKSLTRLYKVGDEYLLLSATLFGIRWHVNAPNLMPDFGSMANFGKKLGNKIKKVGWKGLMNGGLLNADVPDEEIVEEQPLNEMCVPVPGMAVSFTNWWVPALYGMKIKKLPDFETLKNYSLFCCTVRETPNIVERRMQITNQLINNMYIANQQEFAYADQYTMNAQADIHRRQMQISQSLNEQSNIIMSSYENRRAAQDRMSKGFSEAVRGVDTYMGSNRPTEFKTGAKRVIEKNNDPKNKVEIGYLDTVPQGWTEIFKQ